MEGNDEVRGGQVLKYHFLLTNLSILLKKTTVSAQSKCLLVAYLV